MTAKVTTLISYRFRDGEQKEKTMPMYYLGSEVDTVAKAQGIATSMAPLMSAISGCAVVGARVQFELTVPAGDSADAGYRVDAGGTFQFGNTAGRTPSGASIYIPGMLLDRMANDVILNDHASVVAFAGAVVDGDGITGDFTATDASGLKLQDFNGGKQSRRK